MGSGSPHQFLAAIGAVEAMLVGNPREVKIQAHQVGGIVTMRRAEYVHACHGRQGVWLVGVEVGQGSQR